MTDGAATTLRNAAALVYVASLEEPTVDVEAAHHLLDVLRLRDGEAVIAADGDGAFRPYAVLRRPEGRHVTVELQPTADVVHTGRPQPAVTVGFALQKGDRVDWTVQKLTELGVDTILPLLTERTVVRLDGTERERRADRLRRIAREAAAQCRRLHLPEVATPMPFREAVVRCGAGSAMAEIGASGGLGGCASVMVGPEGGWSPTELECGLRTVGLGSTVLRAETAAVVAGTLLCAGRAGLAKLPAGEVTSGEGVLR